MTETIDSIIKWGQLMMNNERRKEIDRIVKLIDDAKSQIDEARDALEAVKDEEQDAVTQADKSLASLILDQDQWACGCEKCHDMVSKLIARHRLASQEQTDDRS